MPFLLESLPQRVVAAQAVGQGVVLSTFLVSPARNMTSAGEHRGTLLERRGVLVVNSRPVDGTDAAGSEVTGVGSSAFGLKFGGGCNSPAQVRVPASASGQGTVAVGSPVPRPMGGHPNALHHAPPEAKKEREESRRGDGLHATSSELPLQAAAASMKRKRPPALSISNDICTHSAGIEKMTPATDRELRDAGAAEEVVVVEGQTYALSSKRGRKRVWCEDAYTAAPGLDGDPTQGIFSVFDGHGGRAAADFAAKHLHDAVLREVNAVSNSPQRQRAGKTAGQVARGLELVEDVKAAMIRGFLATDKRFLAECHLRGGATATTAFLRAGRIWVANVGDCRAVMCEDGQAAALTLDHRPDCAEERRAVERRGGKVVSILGTSRVQGVLGVSRALGDRDLKQFITAEPDVYSGPISDRSEFLILGTDGLWDVVGNQEATALVRACLGLSGGGGDAVPRDVEGGGRMEGSALAPRSSTTTSSVAAAAAVAAASPPKVECECVRDTSGLFGDVAEVATAAVGGSGRKGTDAACRGLVELARIRGSHDDISVLIVELRSYAQGTTPASMPGDQKVAETSPDATSLTSQSMSTPPETSLSS